jgi:tripartite ATP-independent transporter DctP family solute receptor
MMKNTARRRLVAAAVLLAAVGAASAQTKLKWGHVYEASEPFHKHSVWAAEEIRKRTNGKYQIDVYPASQLGRDNDLTQGLTLGAVDMILSGSSFAAKAFPRIGITYYPYTFKDANHLLAYAKSDIYREFAEGYAQKSGNRIVSTAYYGVRHTSSNKPFKTCAEMKGMKVRVPDQPLYKAMPAACGANPAPIAFAEVYLALQNGTVDAQENPLTTLEAKKFYEVQKHIVLTGHIVDHVNTVISGQLWGKLGDAEKKLFADIAQEASARATADILAREQELTAEFRKRGLTVTEVNTAEFRDAVVKSTPFEQFGLQKADFDRIQALAK